MENFGIFSLISALARQAAGGEEGGGAKPAESGAERAREQRPPQDEEAVRRMRRAQGILERHEAISRRIDRNNR